MLKSIGARAILAAVFVVTFAFSASASPITFTWVGSGGFSGFFTMDSSVFTTAESTFQVPDTDILAFSFSGDGVTFDLADVELGESSGAAVNFDTTVSPPAVQDGAGGNMACDPAGDCVGLYGATEVTVFLASGDYEDSTGSWTAETSSTPEPTTLMLLGAGLLGIGFRRRKLA